MTRNKRFPEANLKKINIEWILGIRAGSGLTHRVIGIWAVVVDGRVFVRSWSMKLRSWWRTFLEDPHGEILVASANAESTPARCSGGYVAQSLTGCDDRAGDDAVKRMEYF